MIDLTPVYQFGVSTRSVFLQCKCTMQVGKLDRVLASATISGNFFQKYSELVLVYHH